MHFCSGGQFIVVLALFLASGQGAETLLADDASAKSDKSTRRILAQRCVACHNASDRKGGLDLTEHGAALAGGESGRVIEPGRPDDSLLWQYVSSGEMPPKKPLPDVERAALRDWIQQGAAWEGGAIDPYQHTNDFRAGYDWWSLQPLTAPVVPQEGSNAQGQNAIDQFIRKRLHAATLDGSSAADRRVLIRRLYCDLLGLLPAPAEVASFVDDRSPHAYEQLVDRLLASPQYGERWARHWLDVVRFGESQGFERDKLRPNAWRYRDWLIAALNADMPYQEFARLQIAGDVIRAEDDAAAIATGFLVAGPYDEVGQQQQSEAMRFVVREDELEDLVSTVGQTFLGLTVNCARCHDHKFDPIRQTEYYRLCASLAGVKHGERTLKGAGEAAAAMAQIAARIRTLETQLRAIESPIRERILAERAAKRSSLTSPEPIAEWQFESDLRDGIGELHATAMDGASIVNGKLMLDGKGYAATVPLRNNLTEKTLEAWVSLANLQQQGGAVIGVQTLDGKTFDAIVYGEREARQWVAGSNNFTRTQSFGGSDERDSKQGTIHIALVYRGDGTIAAYRNGLAYGRPYKTSGPAAFAANATQVVFGLRHSPPGGNKLLRGALDRARLYDRALTDDEIAASAGAENHAISEAQWSAELTPSQSQLRADLRFEVEQLREHQSRLGLHKTYAVTPEPPSVTHVLLRGNPANKGDVALPGGIASLNRGGPGFSTEDTSSDSQRRQQLSAWITDASNPLFARVIVNRLWHYHFGVGLVETPNDFGFNGGRPTHPELLDWLATELIRSGWSLKHIQRLIVLSATYRQASVFDASKAGVDADNRLLWRKSPRRLEAESLRDIMLQLAGELDEAMFGPGYYDFSTYISNSQFYSMRDPVGQTFQRRSIYRTWLRSGRSPLLDVFDCPDPSTKTPQRAVTTTPLQALSLLNNSFVLRTADRFAERIKSEAGDNVNAQLNALFEFAYGRRPEMVEQKQCVELIRRHGLAAMCRVVLNSNELLYVD
jgi:mono/diheme cytochrome c family protein